MYTETRHTSNLSPDKAEAIRQCRADMAELMARNALEACRRKEAGEPVPEGRVYHNEDDEIEGKNG